MARGGVWSGGGGQLKGVQLVIFSLFSAFVEIQKLESVRKNEKIIVASEYCQLVHAIME